MPQSLSRISLRPFLRALILILLPLLLLCVSSAPPSTATPAADTSTPAGASNAAPLWISGQIVTLPATAATPDPLASGLPLTYDALEAMEDQAPSSFEILMRPSFQVASGDTARYTMTSHATREAGRITTILLNMELTPTLQPDDRVALSARIVAYDRHGRAESKSDTRLLLPDSGHYDIFGPFHTNDRKLFVILRVDRQPPAIPPS